MVPVILLSVIQIRKIKVFLGNHHSKWKFAICVCPEPFETEVAHCHFEIRAVKPSWCWLRSSFKYLTFFIHRITYSIFYIGIQYYPVIQPTNIFL